MPVVAVIFGWPAVIASLAFLSIGVAISRWKLVVAGAVIASPFLFYLSLTPRFQWIAPPVAVLLFFAAWPVARRNSPTALAMVAPYASLVLFVAWLVISQ